MFENLKTLEGLDISGCFSVDLSCLIKLRYNKTLKCLLLEYLLVRSEQLKHLTEAGINTLSVFCKSKSYYLSNIISTDSKTVAFTHVEVLKEIKSLTNLNISDCP